MSEIDVNDVAIFVRVIELSGFANVARERRVPTSTVSRAVSRLEQALGVRLVQRTTRNMMPTEEGRMFYEDVAPALTVVRNAARGLEGAGRSPRGRLRLSAPHDVGTTFLPPLVVEFAQRFPLVNVEVHLSSRMVNLVEEGFDLAVRAGSFSETSLVSRRVGDIEWDLYGSASYVEQNGTPRTLDDLDQHTCVLFRPRGGETEWRLHGRDGKDPETRKVRGRIGGDDFEFVRAAILAGGGIGLLPRITASGDVAAGKLVRVLPQYEVHSGVLHMVYPSARQVPAKVALFSDFVIDSFARMDLHDGIPDGHVNHHAPQVELLEGE
ncbi:LysR family transcriptional regulator [Pendulispora rubella]|uniref:LysR family transcriptional regulator n=1 Tax=Pendulispora rubella TaxID=2741070 RepID=A0ABZ2LJY6_9BACT